MDESNPTCNKRFASLGIPQTVEARRAYRELIVTTPGLGEFISCAISYDETIRQHEELTALPCQGYRRGGESFPASRWMPAPRTWRLIPEKRSPKAWMDCATASRSILKWAPASPSGARCLPWAMPFPAEAASRPTRRRWLATPRCARKPDSSPSSNRKCLWTARIRWERCRQVTEEVPANGLLAQLYTQRVMLEGMILKPNMVLPGLTCPKQEAADEVADATVASLAGRPLAAVPGIAFLSGGQSTEMASARLNAMNVRFRVAPVPGRWRFRSDAPSSNQWLWRSGAAMKSHVPAALCSKPCITEPDATEARAAANTPPRMESP